MPWIHDVSTDPADPPPFVALRAARLKCANGADYSGLGAGEHARNYPDLVTAEFSQNVAAVFQAARAVAQTHQWKIAAAVEAEGRIEATATTRVFRFKDDVVVRIRAHAGGGSRLDIRSKSRVGESDLGANARRIRTWLSLLITRLKTNT